MEKLKKFVATASIATILSLGIPVNAIADGEETPDLFLDEIVVSEDGMLNFTVSNIGTVDIDVAVSAGANYVYIDDFDTPAYAMNWADYSEQNFLLAGGSSTFEITELYGDHEVMVCVDATEVVDEGDENNNCAVTQFSVDLEVTDVYLLNGDGALSADIVNNGNGAIDPTTDSYTYFYIDDMDHAEYSYSWLNLADQGFMTPNGTSTLSTQPLSGSHTVRVCVDTYELVDESNEDNNCLDVEFTPDLYINDIYLSGASQLLTVEMGNQGNVAVDPDTEQGHTYIYIDDMEDPYKTYSWATLADTDFLEIDGLSDLQPAPLNGSHTVMACIDPNEVVDESDETNNCMEITFQADLVLDDIYLNDSDLLTVQVSNQGNTSVDLETEDGFTYIYIDDMDDPVYTYKWSNLADQDFLEVGGVSDLQPLVMDESHTVYACVDATEVVDESDETNNCMEVTFEADLAVTDVTLDDSSILTIELSNLGNLNVDPESGGRVYVYVDDMDSPVKNYDWSLLADQDFLEVGGVSYMQTHSLDSDVHDVRVCVDATDVVAETDEDNNCFDVTFGADLTVTDVYLSGSLLSIDLANLGNIDIDPTETQGSIYIYVDDMENPEKTYNWNTLANQDFLNAGGTSTMQPMTLEAGTHDVLVCVDALDTVVETDETNNCFEVSLGPDLTVTDVYRTESNVLSIDLTNIGTVDVSPSTTGYVYIYIDDMDDAEYKYNWTMIDDNSFLDIGGETTISPQVLEGDHEVMACVDATDTVSELDEDNNCMSVTLGEPDLTVTDIYLAEGNVLTAEMANIGLEAVPTGTAGETTLYVDDMDTPTMTYSWQDDLADQDFFEIGGVSLLQPVVFEPDSGEREVMVCMDSSDVVEESDEDNNCLQVTVDTTTDDGSGDDGSGDDGSGDDGSGDDGSGDDGSGDDGSGDDGSGDDGSGDDGSGDDGSGDDGSGDDGSGDDGSGDGGGGGGGVNPDELPPEDGPTEYYNDGSGDGGYTTFYGGGGSGGIGGGSSSSSSSSSDSSVVLAEDDTTTTCEDLAFVDADETASYYDPLSEAWCRGYVHGRGSLFFYPNAPILRGEVAKVVSIMFGYGANDITGDYFPDVDEDDPEVAPYIEALAEAGILNGYGDGNFRPHQAITIYEIKIIMRRILGETVTLSADGNGTISRGSFMEFIMQYAA